MSVDLNRAAMLESNSPRFESLIAQTAAQELWTWTSGPVAGLRCLNSQDRRQCCRRFQHALHTCLGGRSSLRGRAARSGAAKGLPRYNDLHYAYVLAGRANSLTSGKLRGNLAHIPAGQLLGNAGPTPFRLNCLRANRKAFQQ